MSLSGAVFKTFLTSEHASWNRFNRRLHIPNEDIVDEIQLKARMQQRHHRVYPEIGIPPLSLLEAKTMLFTLLKMAQKMIMCTKYKE